MSIRIQNHVWQLELPAHVKYVAIALADHAHDDGTEARPSQEYLAVKTGLSVRQIRRCLRELVEMNVIIKAKHGGRNRAVTYAFVLGDISVPQSGSKRGTSVSERGTSATVLRDTSVPLTIKNHHLKQSKTEIEKVNVASSETARAAIAEIRRNLRSSHRVD